MYNFYLAQLNKMIQSAKLHDLKKKPNTMLANFLLLYPGQNITNSTMSFPV
jgi:uncharacterized membrane protein